MPTDQVVTAQDLLQALMEVRRRGSGPALEELERVEPDLAEYLMEEVSRTHQQLLNMRAKPKAVRRLIRQIESLSLVLVTALHQAHLRLWQQDATGTRLAQIDPTLSSKDASPPPADDPPAEAAPEQ